MTGPSGNARTANSGYEEHPLWPHRGHGDQFADIAAGLANDDDATWPADKFLLSLFGRYERSTCRRGAAFAQTVAMDLPSFAGQSSWKPVPLTARSSAIADTQEPTVESDAAAPPFERTLI